MRALPLLASLLAACTGGSSAPRSAVLVTLDTTRADHLAPYGGLAGATPTLARLAREGVTFEHAYTVAPITLPAHASMLTGLYPPRHGVRENGVFALPAEARTLAELAREAGLDTAAFVSAAVLDRAFGLDQGFDVYDAPARPLQQGGTNYAERSGTATVARAVRWLAGRGGQEERGFLLWVHLFDPHAPYAPPPPFQGGPNAYLGEIAAMDAALGQLLDGLADAGVLDETLVVVVGDHGEGLGDHGELTHSLLPFEATLRAPLLLRWPDGRGAGTRRSGIASVVDVLPTVASALGLGAPDGVDGLPLDAEVPAERGVYFESYAGWLSFGYSPLAGWLDREGKYVHTSRPALFDPFDDPSEGLDLATARADELERYRRAIADLYARPALGASAADVDAELREEIGELGYAAAGAPGEALPHPLAPSDRPSPLDRVEEQNQVVLAQRRLNAGQLREAERLLRTVVSANPRNRYALDRLALVLIRAGRHEEAVTILQRLADEGPASADLLAYLGAAHLGLEQHAEAARAFRAGLAVDPDHAQCLGGLAHALDKLGRADESREVRARLRAVEAR